MSDNSFPEMITRLPQADIPLDGVRAWLSQAADHQIAFFDIDPIGEVPPHSHGEQWGIVVEGAMELTIDGQPGDTPPAIRITSPPVRYTVRSSCHTSARSTCSPTRTAIGGSNANTVSR